MDRLQEKFEKNDMDEMIRELQGDNPEFKIDHDF